jgi:hypothetical protein
MTKFRSIFLGLICCLGMASVAFAVPATIPFQGRLTDASGTALNGSFSIRFSLWNSLSGGVEQWNETQPTVTVTNGIFRVDLGSVTALTPAIVSGQDMFLEMKVGADAAMTPRQRMGSTLYAFRSGDAPGVAANHSTSPGSVASGNANLCSQTVTYPGPGTAIVTTWVSWEVDNNTPGVGSQSAFGISETSAGFDGQSEYFAILSASSASAYTADVSSLMRVYNIGAAGAHTYFTVVTRQGGGFIHHGTYMTVQYFPNTIGTVTGAPAIAPAASAAEPTQADLQARKAANGK